MEAFQNALNQSNASFSRREAGIEGINQAGAENYNLAKARNSANFNASKQLVAGANEALKTQTGIETAASGIGAEPLIKGGVDMGAKNLYAAGKQAKATRLGAQSDAIEAGDTQGASALESRGASEVAADAMDSELAQNVGAVLKAPGQLVSKAGDLVGQGVKSAGKAVYQGGKNVIQSARARFGRNPGDPDEGGQELGDVEASGAEDTGRLPNLGLRGGTGSRDIAEQAMQGQEKIVANPEQAEAISGVSDAARGEPMNIGDAVANRPPTANLASRVQTQKTQLGSQAENEARLGDAGDSAQAESDTLVTATGEEASGAASGAAGGAGATEAGAGAATAAVTEGATAGEIAADAAAGALDASAIAAESVPGVGTVVGGLLALGGGIAALFEGGHQKKKAPAPPPPPPKPKPLGINVSEAAPVMDSSIYRATGYNQLA